MPVLQLPDDLVQFPGSALRRAAELMIETGVFQSGSTLLHASLWKALSSGGVVGPDINVPATLWEALERHDLSSLITLIEGDSASPVVLREIEGLRKPDETTLVLLDSDHSRRTYAEKWRLTRRLFRGVVFDCGGYGYPGFGRRAGRRSILDAGQSGRGGRRVSRCASGVRACRGFATSGRRRAAGHGQLLGAAAGCGGASRILCR